MVIWQKYKFFIDITAKPVNSIKKGETDTGITFSNNI